MKNLSQIVRTGPKQNTVCGDKKCFDPREIQQETENRIDTEGKKMVLT